MSVCCSSDSGDPDVYTFHFQAPTTPNPHHVPATNAGYPLQEMAKSLKNVSGSDAPNIYVYADRYESVSTRG